MYVYNVFLSKKEPVGSQAIQLTLKFPDKTNFEFKPGQYIWLVLPKLDNPDPKGERRAFSITSSATDKESITIQAKLSDSGYKRTLINLPENSSLQIIGPFGSSYVIDPLKTGSITMIAGGVAIAPFSSIIRSLQSLPIASKLKIIYCSASPETSCFTPDLDQICRQHGISVTKHLGDFRENILPAGIDFVNDEFFVCGPEELVNAVCTVLFAKGVPLYRIHLEQFYPKPIGNLTEEDFILKPGESNIMLQAVQQSKNHVIITDANGVIIFANKTAETSTGYTFNEMRGNTPRLWGGLMPAAFYQDFWRKKHEPTGFDGQITNRRKNGQTYTVIIHVSPIFSSDNVVIGFIGTEEDITEQLNMVQKIQQDKLQDEAILQSIGEGVIVSDAQGNVIFVNSAAASMLLYSDADLIGHKFQEIVKAEDLNGRIIEENERPIVKAIKMKQLVNTKVVYYRKDNTKFISGSIITPFVIQGNYVGAVMVFEDVTKATEIDKMKSEFISLASHQLRTPLSTINWYTETLLSGENGEITQEQKQFLDEIYSASKRMVALVNSLLNVSRIELGTMIIEPIKADLVKLLKTEISNNALQIKNKNIQVVENYSIESLELPLDTKLIQMVLQNLLTNSIKYSPENTKITVGISKTDQDITISVADQGIGIPKNEQSEIFLKLFRAANAKAKISDGNGLGLYLAKMIMDQSGGKIWFESEEGKGTTFYIELPISGMIKKDGTKDLS